MAVNKRYATDYPAAGTLSGAELVQVVQSGTDSQLSLTNLIAWFRGLIGVFTKNQSVTPVNLVDGTSIAVDAATSNNFAVTLGGNRTLANPSNLTAGMVLNFRVKQDATGSRTLSFGNLYKFPGGIVPVLSTGVAASDLISCYYDGTILLCNVGKGYA